MALDIQAVQRALADLDLAGWLLFDNLETRDERTLILGVAFSIEPGIYLPEFGVRSEIVVHVTADGADVTGDTQTEIARLAA